MRPPEFQPDTPMRGQFRTKSRDVFVVAVLCSDAQNADCSCTRLSALDELAASLHHGHKHSAVSYIVNTFC